MQTILSGAGASATASSVRQWSLRDDWQATWPYTVLCMLVATAFSHSGAHVARAESHDCVTTSPHAVRQGQMLSIMSNFLTQLASSSPRTCHS